MNEGPSHRSASSARIDDGNCPYDTLGLREQGVVRAEWSSTMDALGKALDLAREFAAAGRTWVELDDDGAVVHRGGAGSAG